MFKKTVLKNDLEKQFLHLWEKDRKNLLYELESFPLAFFTDRELIFTEEPTKLTSNYYTKLSKILFSNRVFEIKLIFDKFDSTILDVKQVREYPLEKYI